MIEKLFLDTNIILDVMLNRVPFNVAAANILDLGYRGEIELFATSLSFANALYISRKEMTTDGAVSYFEKLNTIVKVIPTTQKEMERAFSSHNPDFEDAMQYATAESLPVDCIITRNEKHFRFSSIPVKNAVDYLLERHK